LIRFFIQITYENSWMNNQMNDTTGSGYYRIRILQGQDTTGSGYYRVRGSGYRL
jgi:hypothetical protein